jgi:ectoine hydroxylase
MQLPSSSSEEKIMELTAGQIGDYERDGFLFLKSLFSTAEMSILQRETAKILASDRREIVREKDGATPRSVFNMHAYNDAFAKLVHHPKIVDPITQLLRGPIYVFQIVLNFKQAFGGDAWPWHQDYPTYHFDDGMPRPRVVNALIFMDEVNNFNGPLMLIPGSHRIDFPLPAVDTTKTSYPARWLPEKYLASAALENGIVAPSGPPGSVIFAHTNIVHGSAPNMSPWNRSMISLTVNALDNVPVKPSRRPDFIVPADRTPLQALSEDCLLAMA